jgi:hypothetical protein
MDKLTELIERIGRRALAGREPTAGHELVWARELRAAFVAAAHAGELAGWGVTDGAQLDGIVFRARVSDTGALCVATPEKIASHLRILRLRRDAEAGSVVAQGILGACYLHGNDVEVDHAEALRLLTLASRQGAPRPTLNLARMYEFGLGVSADPCQAVRLYQRAARAGEFLAQVALGRAYAHGDGVAADAGLAYQWYAAAAAQDGRVVDSEELREAKAYVASRAGNAHERRVRESRAG